MVVIASNLRFQRACNLLVRLTGSRQRCAGPQEKVFHPERRPRAGTARATAGRPTGRPTRTARSGRLLMQLWDLEGLVGSRMNLLDGGGIFRLWVISFWDVGLFGSRLNR